MFLAADFGSERIKVVILAAILVESLENGISFESLRFALSDVTVSITAE
jgi:hypothetical protein